MSRILQKLVNIHPNIIFNQVKLEFISHY